MEPPAGNTFDKYGATSPLVRRVMSGFFGALDDLVAAAGPAESMLDVGCGEGVITRTWARRWGDRRVVGFDRDSPVLREHWSRAAEPNLSWAAGDAHALPYDDDSFDVVSSIEMIMQVAEPDRVLSELTRVARRAVLVSAAREPVWRALNVASGRYVRDLGNSPGNVHHWSRRSFVGLVGAHARVEAVRTPLPWTIVLARP